MLNDLLGKNKLQARKIAKAILARYIYVPLPIELNILLYDIDKKFSSENIARFAPTCKKFY
jgi:hypothetical protein